MRIIKKTNSLDDFLGNLSTYPAGTVCFEPWGKQFPCMQKPDVIFRIAYNDNSLFVYMRCTNDDVRSEVREHNGSVNHDSCMEFYFAPGIDVNRYFNMEVNPAGFVRLKYGGTDRVKRVIPTYRLEELELTTDSDPAAGTWCMSYALPYSMIKSMAPDFTGSSGSKIYGIFCKCGDLCREKHYLTSAPVNLELHPIPDFHAPESYEEFIFE